ncbi:hypothetical protein DSM03_1011225 [Leeuwenhoekiella aestuarii]|uniref:Uncharacterized protein n=1 Tax=Leeuwenhoekiella aestuarii TaxID=2249426 RepID=A0A4Q0NZW9_9FLAO|nr:hypothetical protein DSM04_101736 [Leeuwenhoekiella aestuarii]RXG19839.1 hypothetical protein DSM03_1011225 [Leeuwenhoekiella aestuarii]
MRKQVEASCVNKIILLMFFLTTPFFSYGQKNQYLLFDICNDSIFTSGDMKYYNIDDNLFEISRYQQVDTISGKWLKNIEFTTINKLWVEGEKLHNSIINEGVKKKSLKVIETYNQLFEHIYVIEKLQNDKFKRTRVWWIDY